MIDGVDFTKVTKVDFLNKFLVVDFDKETIPLNFDEYDYILLLDVIEHIKNPEKFLNTLGEKMANFPKQKLIMDIRPGRALPWPAQLQPVLLASFVH